MRKQSGQKLLQETKGGENKTIKTEKINQLIF